MLKDMDNETSKDEVQQDRTTNKNESETTPSLVEPLPESTRPRKDGPGGN